MNGDLKKVKLEFIAEIILLFFIPEMTKVKLEMIFLEPNV